jgi:hypothetical protein
MTKNLHKKHYSATRLIAFISDSNKFVMQKEFTKNDDCNKEERPKNNKFEWFESLDNKLFMR